VFRTTGRRAGYVLGVVAEPRRGLIADRRGYLPGYGAVAALMAFSLVFVVRAGGVYRGRRFFTVFEDMAISLRYASNLAHGHGLVWNAGTPRVEGYTNLLWTLWMAFLVLVRVPTRMVPLAVSLSAMCLLAATAFVVRALAERLSGSRRVGSVAMWLTVGYYPLVYWSLRGTEVALLSFWICAACLLSLRVQAGGGRRDVFLLAGIGGLAFLTRPDAIVAMAVMDGWVILNVPRQDRRRLATALFGSLLAVVATSTIFRELYYGQLLPNTYYLKVSGTPLGIRLRRGSAALFATWAKELGLPSVLAAWAWIRHRADRPLTLVLGVVLAQIVYDWYAGGDVWDFAGVTSRYVVVVCPLLLAATSVAVADIAAGRLSLRDRAGLAAGVTAWLLVRWSGYLPWSTLLGPGRLSPDSRFWRLALPSLAVLLLVVLLGIRPIQAAGRVGLGRAAVVAMVVALGLVMSARWLDTWVHDRGYFVADDDALAQLAMSFRMDTSPRVSIAGVAVGQFGYYSDRTIIDLFGKTDSVVAHTPPHRLPYFLPGHDKWDYSYSVGTLRPDITPRLPDATPTDMQDLTRWGYQPLDGTGWWIRTASAGSFDEVDLIPALRDFDRRISG